ncbi:MAG: DsbA family protein [Chloroflexi bacterium]|nr:DsbA family protein [Chloroflexota bacterium]
MSPLLPIHIFFDYICPWCYVTDLALERLEERYPITLIPKSFPLWAEGLGHLPPEENEALRQRTHAADAHALTAAREWLNVDGMLLGPWGVATLDAHAGAKFAAARGRLMEYQRVLFDAHFFRDLRLDSRETLSLLAAEAGLPSDDFLSALDDDFYRRAALNDQAQAVQLGITGVPALVVDNRYLVVGARPPERLAGIIERALGERKG